MSDGKGIGSAIAIGATAVASAVFFVWPLAGWISVRGLETPKYKVKKVLGSAKRAFYDRAPAFEIREYPAYVVAETTVTTSEMKEATSRGFRQVADYIFGNNMGSETGQAQGPEQDPDVLDGKKMKGGKGSKIAMTSPVMIEMDEQVLAGQKIKGGKGEKIAMTSPVMVEMDQQVLDGQKIKGGNGEKIAMTSPVSIAGDNGKYIISFVMPSKYTLDTLPKARNPNVEFREVPPQLLASYSIRGGPYPTEAIVAERREKLEKALEGTGYAVRAGAKASVYGYYPPFVPRWQNLWEVLVPVVSTDAGSSSEDKKDS